MRRKHTGKTHLSEKERKQKDGFLFGRNTAGPFHFALGAAHFADANPWIVRGP